MPDRSSSSRPGHALTYHKAADFRLRCRFPYSPGQSHLGSPTSLLPSFPRKRESRGEWRVLGRWIPACAGMTEERKATVSPNAIALPYSPSIMPIRDNTLNYRRKFSLCTVKTRHPIRRKFRKKLQLLKSLRFFTVRPRSRFGHLPGHATGPARSIRTRTGADAPDRRGRFDRAKAGDRRVKPTAVMPQNIVIVLLRG
jgi:hypothetical protein